MAGSAFLLRTVLRHAFRLSAGCALLGLLLPARDWRLSWESVEAPDLAGYEVTVRRTTETFPSRVIPVGDTTTYVLENTQADRLWIGLRAVDEEGHRLLIRSFHGFPELPPAFTE